MSSNQTYPTGVARILQWRRTERIPRVHNMAQLLTGIGESQSVHLSKVATQIARTATLPSVTRRLRRFLDNPAVRVREGSQPILGDRVQCVAQSGGAIRLLADARQVGCPHPLLVMAVADRRRTIPRVGTWGRASTGHSAATKQLARLGYLPRGLPKELPVVRVGDRELGAIPLIQPVQQWGWDYVLRQKANPQGQRQEPAPWRNFGPMVQQPGPRAWFDEVHLTLPYAHPTNRLA